jgi:hypothetical protein
MLENPPSALGWWTELEWLDHSRRCGGGVMPGGGGNSHQRNVFKTKVQKEVSARLATVHKEVSARLASVAETKPSAPKTDSKSMWQKFLGRIFRNIPTTH